MERARKDGTRHGRRDGKRGGRKRTKDGLSEEGREQGREENFNLGRVYPEEGTGHYMYIHKPSHNATLALATLVLQMKNNEQVSIINSVLFDWYQD